MSTLYAHHYYRNQYARQQEKQRINSLSRFALLYALAGLVAVTAALAYVQVS